ncbi:conserved oligomeric Golgi complex subunit 2-like isoform X1 [Mustela lutreola]|uniref:conserved oligomeric Golgi complex subunit 2-like n=2 Tax=Mustela lutreola TaxID=9666 RepID=UPI00279736ED|nr:conserved oligomeric Golgi complex subunit 2-like isoform X1 [Mustela lutreola]XP_058993743.1 conserved oligomeric Golgi complex subunit 2-like [Mustela lutreola]XP_058993866.1 conserved oligomeric Golgi complex subunit 2-like [Mustela lutreola]XP_058993930.1 conserved oligomeric Golgi complex subunit 2-like isoform X1 [Mustela lutreola]XP_058993933.1 conserved oligomeric Golgi complex subunit 2-like isoform X1 [Mustela lutreola]XP_058993937.1 conserved oligomeric Golgi complex subunit 2-li
MERSRMNLPKGLDTLCFDKDEFMKEDFDVDHVVSDCRKRVQLEELRGDLELYYKLLKQPWLSSSTRIMQILSTFPQTWLAWTKPSMNFLCLWDSYEKFW